MRIALVNPPIFDPSFKQTYDLIPMGLLKIAPWLRSIGHTASLFQFEPFYAEYLANVSTPNEVTWHIADVNIALCDGVQSYPLFYRGTHPKIIVERLQLFAPDEVWITTGLTYHIQGIEFITSLVKRHLPGTSIRIGGLLATLAPEKLRFLDVDDIHSGPLPAADDFQLDYDYLDRYPGITNIKLHRGCVVSKPCVWCAVKALEPVMELSELDHVFTWIIERARTGDKVFRIWSSNLFYNEQIKRELLTGLALIHNEFGCEFEAAEGIEPWLFDETTAINMVNAGFRKVSIPLESHLERIRKTWGKPGSVERCLDGIKAGLESGMRVRAFCMIGVPDQTLDDVYGVIDFCLNAMASPRLMPYSPIPRTTLWQKSRRDWDNKHLLFTHGYFWPEVNTVAEIEQLEILLDRYLYSKYRPLRGGNCPEKIPTEERIFFNDLNWPKALTVHV